MTIQIQIDGEVRQATPDEIARIEADRQAQQEREQAAADLRAAVRAKIKKLGFSDDEIAALIGE